MNKIEEIRKNNILIQKMLLRNESYTPLQKYFMWEMLRNLGD